MAYKIKDIDHYILKYKDDPVGFVRVVIEAEPTREQLEILEAVKENRLVSVRSGHGIGKSTSLAWLILWFLCTRNRPKIPCTAPTSQQLNDILWSELAKWHAQMNLVFRRELYYTSQRIYWKSAPKESFAVAKVSRKEQPEALSGMHGENLMFVVEEASGVPGEIFQPIEGALTGRDNYMIMVGNPIWNTGYFYDSHHKDRKAWKTLHYNSENAELVDSEYPARMARKYGRDSNIYKVRVLGDFPTMESDQLIDLEWLEAATVRYQPHLEEEGRIVWGLDVARFGSDETCLVKKRGNAFIEISTQRKKDTMYISGWVKRQYDDCQEKDRPEAINVDVIGIGAGVADRMRELKLPVADVKVSRRSKKPKKYSNLRAELWCIFRDWLKEGKGSMVKDEDLIGQASTIKYEFDSSGRYLIESKDDMKKRGLISPDRADAVCLTFAEAGDLKYAF